VSAPDTAFELRLSAEPALAVTVRSFVAESAHKLGLDEGDIEDLRLLASELLANAVETGGSTVTIRLDAPGGVWRLTADGIGSLGSAAPNEIIDRELLLRGLATIRMTDEGSLECSALIPAAD
jgi:hypothetical protein